MACFDLVCFLKCGYSRLEELLSARPARTMLSRILRPFDAGILCIMIWGRQALQCISSLFIRRVNHTGTEMTLRGVRTSRGAAITSCGSGQRPTAILLDRDLLNFPLRRRSYAAIAASPLPPDGVRLLFDSAAFPRQHPQQQRRLHLA